MKQVVLLGGSGFIGKEICSLLLKDPSINVFSPSSSELNLLNKWSTASWFKKNISFDFTLIIAAARTPYSSSVKDDKDAMLENIIMVKNIIKCLSNKCKEIIFLSTIDVYAKSKEKIKETSLLKPTSNYAVSKLEAENIFRIFSAEKNIPLLILRLTQVYGFNDNSPKLIPAIISSAKKMGIITINGNGKTLRDYLHVNDAAKIITLSIGKNMNGIINVASGISMSVKSVAEIIQKAIIPVPRVIYSSAEDGKSDIVFDITELKSKYSYRFKNLEVELNKMCR